MTKTKSTKTKLGISIGDPNGIGIEVILRTLADNRLMELFTPIIFGGKSIILSQTKTFQFQDLKFNFVASVEDASNGQINVITVCDESFEQNF